MLSAARTASRLSSRCSRSSLLASARLAAVPVARIARSPARPLSDGTHDDFKPQKKVYADESGDVAAQIQKDVDAHKVVVFMKGVPDAPMCGFSNTVVQVLKAEGVEFKGFNVLADPELREVHGPSLARPARSRAPFYPCVPPSCCAQGIKAFSSWPTIPQVYIGGEFIGGCDTTVEMYKSGELRTMLTEAGAKE